jgi:hypothetical protein
VYVAFHSRKDSAIVRAEAEYAEKIGSANTVTFEWNEGMGECKVLDKKYKLGELIISRKK